MSSTDTLAIPAADTPEGALWREILAHDDTNAAAIPAGDGGMLMGGNALSPPDLVGLVNQSDTNGRRRRLSRQRSLRPDIKNASDPADLQIVG